MVRTTQGIVHGKRIELEEDLGIPEGQQVEIQVTVIESAREPPRKWGDGLRHCAGVLAGEWTEEDDRILEAIHNDRQISIRPSWAS